MFDDLYRHKRVFVTGHTGFKGSWLCEWLLNLGAEVTGYSIGVGEEPDHFVSINLERRLNHIVGDVRDRAALRAAMMEAAPDFVFHLAAQALVRFSYEQPMETMETNVMGTVNVLDVMREFRHSAVAVVVTSDKCYENREVLFGYREDDPLGGHDPYSASKGAAEIVANSYRRSFFMSDHSPVRIATARAGNVIGGGDWAEDRIVPDCMASLSRGMPIEVRNPAATRPWQHVLEPLSGYLWLAAALTGEVQLPRIPDRRAASAPFNFGPWPEANRPVRELVEEILKHWQGEWKDRSDPGQVHEAHLLSLAIDKAHHILQWHPVWGFERAVERTAAWYNRVSQDSSVSECTRSDVEAYVNDAREAQVRWAAS